MEDGKFIKDILSFSNTIRQESAYIIFGVGEDAGTNKLLGLDFFPDDGIFQQKAMDKVWPKPQFHTFKYNFQGKNFGVIELPVVSYARPLIAVKSFKSLESDKVYFRRGTTNSEASATEILTISDWLRSIPARSSEDHELSQQVAALRHQLVDNKVAVSTVISKCLALGIKFGNSVLQDFCVNELTGYDASDDDNYVKYPFRLMIVPATPLKVTMPRYQPVSPDEMIAYMSNRNDFWRKNFFVTFSITKLEGIIEDLKIKPSLLELNFPNAVLFPEVDVNIKDGSIYFGPQMVNDLYRKIRNHGISLLTKLEAGH